MRPLFLLLICCCGCWAEPRVDRFCTPDGTCFITASPEDRIGQRVKDTQIWIGNQYAAQNEAWLREQGIQHIVSLVGEPPEGRLENINYLVLNLDDVQGENILDAVRTVHLFLSTCRLLPGSEPRMLIHCHAGVSRSAAVVIGHLMLRDCLSYEEAYQRVKEARSVVHPNAGFVRQLQQLVPCPPGGEEYWKLPPPPTPQGC